MQTIVGIQFRNTGKVYYFAPGKLVFAKGDGAIVETARGLEYAEVVLPNCEVDDSEIKGELKPVVRKATPKDTANYRVNLERRPKAIRDAQSMANKRKLDMKVVDAEFSFDGSKARKLLIDRAEFERRFGTGAAAASQSENETGESEVNTTDEET